MRENAHGNGQGNEQTRFKRRSITIDELQKRQQHRRTRRKVFYVLLFIVLNIVFLSVCFVTLFKVKTVNVTGDTRYSQEEIVSKLGFEMGANIYSFDCDEAGERIIKSLPYLAEVKVERKLPSTVNVTVKEKQASLYLDFAEKSYFLTDDLQVLEVSKTSEAKTEALVKLTVLPENIKRCVVGETLSFSDNRTGDVVCQLYDGLCYEHIENKVREIDATSRFDLYLDYDGTYKVYLGDISECDVKLSFLCGIVDKLYGGSKGKIDVSEVKTGTFSPET